MMNRLFRIVKTTFDVLRAAPGKAVIIQVEADGGENRELEFYQLPGISAGPTAKDRAATVSLSGYRVAVASHNYRIEVDVSSGELILYSTNTAGDTVQSKIKLDTAGNIDLNGTSKTLVTHTELDTALQTMLSTINTTFASKQDASGQTPGAATLDISAAEAATLRTDG